MPGKINEKSVEEIMAMFEPLEKFYFTYGTDEDYPYQGGWTEVYAMNRHEACSKFTARHGSRYPDSKIVNCASIYSADEFEATNMYSRGNFGKRCQEVIV